GARQRAGGDHPPAAGYGLAGVWRAVTDEAAGFHCRASTNRAAAAQVVVCDLHLAAGRHAARTGLVGSGSWGLATGAAVQCKGPGPGAPRRQNAVTGRNTTAGGRAAVG